jgi:hypothetical protein
MNTQMPKFPKHACQFCGSECKLVETLIQDQFIWDDRYGYVANGFTDEFVHTGNYLCQECRKEWTGE